MAIPDTDRHRPGDLLPLARRVVCVHAHPDDETLSTGMLITHLTQTGAEVAVLTATRGELGAVVDPELAHLEGTPELAEHRVGELARALEILGASGPWLLGASPARAAGLPDRRYLDSGVTWAGPRVVGPAPSAGEAALALADPDEVAADVAAFLEFFEPELVLTYNEIGGYGHPDHVAVRTAAVRAAGRLGIPVAEVVTDIAVTHVGMPIDDDAGVEWIRRPDLLDVVARALAAHRTQVEVRGDQVVHSAERGEPIVTTIGLRRVPSPDAARACVESPMAAGLSTPPSTPH